MHSERHVRLFKNGRDRAVRIPRDFELPGHAAVLRKEGNRLILEPETPNSLLALLSSWEPPDDKLPAVGDLPAETVDL